jgi:hypothetical protein
MRFGDIVACVEHGRDSQARMEMAIGLAAATQARLIALYVPSADRVDAPLGGAGRHTVADEINEMTVEFNRLLREHGLNGELVASDRASCLDDLISLSRCADLLIVGLGDPDSDTSPVDIDRLLLACGRPVLGIPLLAPNGRLGRKVMVRSCLSRPRGTRWM